MATAMHHALQPKPAMCSISRCSDLALAVRRQVGYAFKDEVALVEVAHKHNVDLPAVRVRPFSLPLQPVWAAR